MEKRMKRYAIALCFGAYMAVNPVYAVESTPLSSANAISTQADTVPTTRSMSDGEKIGQSEQKGVAGMSKARTQVYQELVMSERDGSLKRLDKTVYRGN
jgi:hypothetical protein